MDLRFPNPVFYDIEATGFSTDSLPIEIGWAHLGPSREIVSEGFLIKPDMTWDLENAWDEIATDLHGIEPLAGHIVRCRRPFSYIQGHAQIGRYHGTRFSGGSRNYHCRTKWLVRGNSTNISADTPCNV